MRWGFLVYTKTLSVQCQRAKKAHARKHKTDSHIKRSTAQQRTRFDCFVVCWVEWKVDVWQVSRMSYSYKSLHSFLRKKRYGSNGISFWCYHHRHFLPFTILISEVRRKWKASKRSSCRGRWSKYISRSKHMKHDPANKAGIPYALLMSREKRRHKRACLILPLSSSLSSSSSSTTTANP